MRIRLPVSVLLIFLLLPLISVRGPRNVRVTSLSEHQCLSAPAEIRDQEEMVKPDRAKIFDLKAKRFGRRISGGLTMKE